MNKIKDLAKQKRSELLCRRTQFNQYPEGTDRLWMAHYRKNPDSGDVDGETLKIDGTLLDASRIADEYAKDNNIILQCLRRRY